MPENRQAYFAVKGYKKKKRLTSLRLVNRLYINYLYLKIGRILY